MNRISSFGLRPLGAIVGVAVAVAWVAGSPAFLVEQQARLGDWLDRQEPAPQSQQIVIVEIDNAALEQHGVWPWPRPLTAKLVSAIAMAGPASLFVDAIFQNPREGDARLVEAFAELGDKNVIGVPVEFGATDAKPIDLPGARKTGAALAAETLPKIVRAMAPLPELLTSPLRIGLMSLDPERTGDVIRGLPCAAGAASGVVYCAALELAAAGSGTGLERFAAMLDRHGDLWLRYPGTWSDSFLPHFSAETILAATESANGIDDLRAALGKKVVIVGVTADAYGDLQQTAWEKAVPGVWIHAVAANQFLTGSTMTLASNRMAMAALVFLVIVGCAMARLDSRNSWSVLIGAFSIVAAVATWYFFSVGYLLPLVPFLAGLVPLSAGLAVARAIEWQLDRRSTETELLQRSQIDALTGIANRRLFDDRLRSEWQRHRRSGASLAVLMIDVDHFKLYNDTYGHRGGDRCLQEVAAVLKEAAKRSGELAARYGGEEFALILPETDLEMALVVANSIVGAVADLKIAHAGSPTAAVVTVSVGVAALVPQDNAGRMQLVEDADRALYAAKHAGRNRAMGPG